MSLSIPGVKAALHNTFTIERTYPVPPARVFAAFADPARKRRWFVESDGHDVEHYELDFRAGGREFARFRFRPGMPVSGLECTNDTLYLNLVTDQRIVFASTMTIAGNCISASLVTVELHPSGGGTTLLLTHQGAFFEGSDGPELREAGWRTLLEQLAAEARR